MQIMPKIVSIIYIKCEKIDKKIIMSLSILAVNIKNTLDKSNGSHLQASGRCGANVFNLW